MEKLTIQTEALMNERFGKDSMIALATADNNTPYVRSVNALYHDRAFYIITYRKSNKMRQIEKNPTVAVAGEWFTGTGSGKDLGYFGSPGNAQLAQMLRTAFAEWIDNGHNDFSDENTIILCVRLKNGILMSHGKRYEIDFTE